jgi:hypothetical protein
MRDHDVVTRIKIWFRFESHDGYPPFEEEGLWATPVGDDAARVDNVPFFALGVAQGDVVRFTTLDDGRHFAVRRVAAGGHCAIRVLPVASGPLGPSADAVFAKFVPFGIGAESYDEQFPLVALDVEPAVDLPRLRALLDQGVADGWWHYETACVSDAWG